MFRDNDSNLYVIEKNLTLSKLNPGYQVKRIYPTYDGYLIHGEDGICRTVYTISVGQHFANLNRVDDEKDITSFTDYTNNGLVLSLNNQILSIDKSACESYKLPNTIDDVETYYYNYNWLVILTREKKLKVFGYCHTHIGSSYIPLNESSSIVPNICISTDYDLHHYTHKLKDNYLHFENVSQFEVIRNTIVIITSDDEIHVVRMIRRNRSFNRYITSTVVNHDNVELSLSNVARRTDVKSARKL